MIVNNSLNTFCATPLRAALRIINNDAAFVRFNIRVDRNIENTSVAVGVMTSAGIDYAAAAIHINRIIERNADTWPVGVVYDAPNIYIVIDEKVDDSEVKAPTRKRKRKKKKDETSNDDATGVF